MTPFQDRIFALVSQTTGGTSFCKIYNGLNINEDYPKTSHSQLKKELTTMLTAKQLVRFSNGLYFDPKLTANQIEMRT